MNSRLTWTLTCAVATAVAAGVADRADGGPRPYIGEENPKVLPDHTTTAGGTPTVPAGIF